MKIDGVVARVDPELDEIRYGENSGGRTIANLQGLNVGLSDKFQIQFLEDNQATITISDESYYHNWGFFSFSGMQGITTIARRYPKACRYINEWIAKQARPGFIWTSFAINRDAKSILHTDCRNLRGE